MQKKLLPLYLFCLLLGVFSCRKQLSVDPFSAGTDARSPETDSLSALLKELAEVLEEVYANNQAYQEVNAGILTGYYADERILLKDLLFPYQSELYRKGNPGRFVKDTGIFRKVFCEIIEKGNFPLLNKALATWPPLRAIHRDSAAAIALSSDAVIQTALLSSGFSGYLEKASIYFPYSDNFMSPGSRDWHESRPLTVPAATLVYADRESDTATGRQPHLCAGNRPGLLCYREVVVHDHFAERHPTHIVGMGAEPLPQAATELPKAGIVTRVYLGWARLTAQFDKLISLTGNGGGSEVKITRVSGYLQKQAQQIDHFSGDLVTVYFSRSDIRQKRWKRIYSIWDADWKEQNSEQVYAVYEEDTKGTKTLSGSLNTLVKAPGKILPAEVKGELAYKIEVMTQDDIIMQRKMTRSAFLSDGRNNQGWNYVKDPNDFLPVNQDWPL